MNTVEEQLTNQKNQYREIFMKSAEEIQKRFDGLKPAGFEGELLDVYEENSLGKAWQKSVLELLDDEISKEVHRKLQEVLAYGRTFHCVGCGSCCRLACSEFSYEELKEKAKNGDNFATQFVSTFVPYDSIDEAEKFYPEYIKLLREKVEEKARSLRMAGRSREASELETAYWNAYDEWVEHIKLASDTDCDYYFSDFFQI